MFFDHYRRHAIKETTRRQCSKNTARPVRRVIEGREVPLPMKWQAFLALGDNKAHGLHLSCKHLLTLHGSIWPLFKRRGCSGPFGDPTTKKKIRGLFFMKSDKSTTLYFPLETQACCYFSWRIASSSHQRCGHRQELQRSQSTHLWRRSQQIFLVTRQVHCYNFTPSPAVTAPRSLICLHLKKTNV